MRLRVHIRWMIERDMPEVLEVEREAARFPWGRDEFTRALRNRRTIGMVAEHNEKVVGFMVYHLHRTHLEIIKFSIHPMFWSRGIGTQMVEKLRAKLSSHRRTYMEVLVPESNLDLQAFWQAAGFRSHAVETDGVDPLVYDDRCEGDERDGEPRIVMHYTLPAAGEGGDMGWWRPRRRRPDDCGEPRTVPDVPGGSCGPLVEPDGLVTPATATVAVAGAGIAIDAFTDADLAAIPRGFAIVHDYLPVDALPRYRADCRALHLPIVEVVLVPHQPAKVSMTVAWCGWAAGMSRPDIQRDMRLLLWSRRFALPGRDHATATFGPPAWCVWDVRPDRAAELAWRLREVAMDVRLAAFVEFEAAGERAMSKLGG